MNAWILILPLLAAANVATARTPAYQCGEGVYSQTPCPGGRVVEATDPRTAAQRAEARRIAQEERRRGQEMERERRSAEKAAQQEPSLAAIGPAKAASAPAENAARPARKSGGKNGKSKKSKASGDFTAVVPKKPKP